jgi:hypothetical protein
LFVSLIEDFFERKRGKRFMSIFAGVVLLLIGLVSSISLLFFSYKEFKKEKNNRGKGLFIVGVLTEILSPTSISGFAFMLSLVAILIGIAILSMS